ncbi:secretion protein [Flavobacterium sp.]|uniref:secretion protein n=1 Tax=Flavobacterium sp. TaxID=239 RepID=UPI00286C1A3B|nr:secretion protein [Flavobacterium sp.]
MRKFTRHLILILLLFVCQNNFAQLYVSNNYVYVADKYLYVKQDINIQNTGDIFLRNQSQLLQAKTGSSINAGAGKLSVFQEGSVNNFAYNYWCSPVGNSITASGNEPFGITMLYQPTTATASTPATILPMNSYNGISNPLSISQGWIFKFLSSSLYSQWFGVYNATAINPGEGFTMKGTAGTDATFLDAGVDNNSGSKQRYDFRGRPNDGDIIINLGAGKRTLTGNPYPSAIDLKAFLLAATNSTGIAYFWEQDKTVNSHNLTAYKGGYGTYSPVGGANVAPYGTMGVYTPAVFYAYDGAGTQLGSVGSGANYERRFCPIGQGFMLEGSSTGTVTMTNNFRVYQKEGAANYSQFERHSAPVETPNENDFLPPIPSVSGFDYTTVSTKPIPQIKFNTLLNNQGIRQVSLAFHPAATDGADFAMDAKSPDITSELDMYFVVDNAEYVIDVIDFDINKRIPIGFKNTTPASFRIKVGDIINFDGTENVYLHDKTSDVYYDIVNGDYEMTLPAGVNNTQYEITFVNATLDIPTLSSDSFAVLQNNVLQTLTVMNPHLTPIKSISLYDITGKLIFSDLNVTTKDKYQFSTSAISDAVYIVKVITKSNQDFGKKVSVYNGH